MSKLSKRSTVYFEPKILQSLKLRATANNLSLSEVVDEAARLFLLEVRLDEEAFLEREHEREISYEELLRDLNKLS